MTKTEKAYLAGLIDEEGTITLTCPGKGQLPQPQISVSNNDLGLLKWIRAKVKCGSILAKKPRKVNHSISYSWQINRIGACIKALKLISPFLRLKREQAHLILRDYLLATPRNGKYTEELLQKKWQLVEQVKSLNKRPKLNHL